MGISKTISINENKVIVFQANSYIPGGPQKSFPL